MTERLDPPQETPEGHLPNRPVSAWTRSQYGCKCEGCLADQRKYRGQKSRADRPIPEHGTTQRYNKPHGCRCAPCEEAARKYRADWYQQNKAKKKAGKPARPPGAIWVDDSGITQVVRCERCDKTYGTWVLDLEAAQAFRQKHSELHTEDGPFDWSAYDKARLIKHPGGRPPLEDKPMCTAEDCTEDAHAKGLCNTHYRRALREAS